MEKYVIEKVIGEGTYGVVYKAKEKVSVSTCGLVGIPVIVVVTLVRLIRKQGSKEYVAIKKFKTITGKKR